MTEFEITYDVYTLYVSVYVHQSFPAEFMEHDVEALPISLSILAELAQVRPIVTYRIVCSQDEHRVAHTTSIFLLFSAFFALIFQKGHAYAKALHYRELEFQSSPATCFESLITINKKLDQYDAAVGILTVVERMKVCRATLLVC